VNFSLKIWHPAETVLIYTPKTLADTSPLLQKVGGGMSPGPPTDLRPWLSLVGTQGVAGQFGRFSSWRRHQRRFV